MAQNHTTAMQIDAPSNLARRGLESYNERLQIRRYKRGDAGLWRSTARG